MIIPFLLREKLTSELSLPAQVSSWEVVELSDTGVLSQHWSQDALPPATGHGLASGLRTQAPFLQMAVRVHTVPHPTHQLTVTGTGTRCSPGSGGFARPRTSRCSGARESGLRPGPVQAGSGREAGEWWPRSLDSWTWAWGPCRKGRGAPGPCSARQLVTCGSPPAGSCLAPSKTGLAPPPGPRSQPHFRESLRGHTSPSCRLGPGHSGAQVEVLNE